MTERLELFSDGKKKEGGYSASEDFSYKKKDERLLGVSFGSPTKYNARHKVCLIWLHLNDMVISYIAYNDHDDFEKVKTIIKNKERSDEVKYGQIKKMIFRQIYVQNKFEELISLVHKNGIAEGRERKRKEVYDILHTA